MSTTPPQPSASSALPPLSSEDFRTFNQMAEVMDSYHNHFRSTWNALWGTATTGRRPQGMTVKQLVRTGLDFVRQLTAHHQIEEMRIFPMLSGRIKEFDPKNGQMCNQHKQIHKGLDELETYLKTVARNQVEFDPEALKVTMESWGSVLWAHLDEEVVALGAENMRKYFTKQEMIMMRI